METQETLTDRFNALQESILNLIEEGPTDLASQIQYWGLTRKEHVLLYYARKSGYNRLGLQPVPTPAVSEYNAKQAIHMYLLLTSLSKSQYASEQWTLADCSAELINTSPKDCFKKRGYTVEVWYDHDKSKAFPYTNWMDIYYQDASDTWHKVEGKVDANGLYYDEIRGDRVYFMLFESNAGKYGVTGEWTVHFRKTTIVSSSSSTRRAADSTKAFDESPSTSRDTETQSTSTRRSPQTVSGTVASSSADSPSSSLRDRRRGQGERQPPTKRRRTDTTESISRFAVPTPSQVGTGRRLPPTTGLRRLERLQAEARDPYIVIIKGPSNNLKCWRNRIPSYNIKYACSNVWRWLGEGFTESRMLLAFDSATERQHFMQLVKLPKGATFAFGNLESL